MYVCMYVCIYVSMYLCIYVSMYIIVYNCIQLYIIVYSCIYIYTKKLKTNVSAEEWGSFQKNSIICFRNICGGTPPDIQTAQASFRRSTRTSISWEFPPRDFTEKPLQKPRDFTWEKDVKMGDSPSYDKFHGCYTMGRGWKRMIKW